MAIDIEGGTANDYAYVTDPVNTFDLSGEGNAGSTPCNQRGSKPYNSKTCRDSRARQATARAKADGPCHAEGRRMVGNCGKAVEFVDVVKAGLRIARGTGVQLTKFAVYAFRDLVKIARGLSVPLDPFGVPIPLKILTDGLKKHDPCPTPQDCLA